jgi:type VI secretion system secreted protein VgrG
VALGKIVDIGMSVREALSFKTEQLGKFLVTSIYHNLDGVGHYYNTFEGIVADTERIPIKEYDKPLPDMQLATVVENDDPKNQGRIKVQFKWECANNDSTEWLRVVSPNAGSGDKGNNRGFMMVPEKGDQVVVAFEEGNIARPVVMGAVYHGKSADSSGFKNSGTKAFNSRMGSTLTFNDDTGSTLLADAKENSVTMDGVGNITINASKSITLVCGGVTIELKAEGETITANGKAITMNGADKVDLKTKEASIDGSDSFKASSKKVVEISSGNTTELKGNSKTTVSATGQTCIEGAVVKLN